MHLSPFFPLCLSFGMVTAAVAQVVQAPGHFGGFISDGSVFTVADDFRLENAAEVVGLTWWGGYFNPPTGPDQFTVRLFADEGGQPGALLQEIVVAPVSKRTTGKFLNEADGLYPEFEYAADLATPWVAEAETTYWLSIVNPPRDTWLWAASDMGADPGVQRRFEGEFWQPYFDNTAFALTVIPEPDSALGIALGLGLLGFWCRRRSDGNR